MKCVFVFIALLSFALCDITCSSSQTYVKFVKKNGDSYASEESFEIYDGFTKLYTSPPFANNEERTIEQCLASSIHNQYTLKLIDSYGDSWYTGSWLAIYGQYGNVVFKNFLTASSAEIYDFSLYYGVVENDQWKLTSGSVSAGWTEYSFNDSNWNYETLGSVTTSVSGTQYFRKQFTGIDNMAAYDVRLRYKYGVVAYINGKEVYRDNMSDGEVTSSTPATGEHIDLAYRAFIRPGSEVSRSLSVLAVEIHFLPGHSQTTVDFNAYIALLKPSILGTSCYIYGDSVAITANPDTDTPANIFDFGKSSYFYASSTFLPNTMTFNFGGPRPYINSFRVWPYSNPAAAPTTFAFQGSYDGNTWTTVVDVAGTKYVSGEYKMFTGYFRSSLYKNYRAVLTSSTNPYIYAYEMQPLICSTLIPNAIIYTPGTYTFYAFYEEVRISPDVNEFTSCSATGLPEGLTIDPTTCEVYGFSSSVVSEVTVTVTSVVLGETYNGFFTLSLVECSGVVINVLRTYDVNAIYETFEIKNAKTQEVVMSVAYNSGQRNYLEWTDVLCVAKARYTVSVDSTLASWAATSHLYVRAVLAGTQMENLLRLRYDSYVGFPTTRTFNTDFAVMPHANWYYMHAEVPENWYSSASTEGWTQGTDSTFPSSTNQIQLYKSTFNVTDICNIAGLVLSIKYKYGIVVYLNGNEAFRNGVTGTVSTSSYGTNIYSDVMYRQVSLPIKTVSIKGTDAVNYVQNGTNSIAVALVAANAQQTDAIFDCAIRLMGEAFESRVFDYTVTYNLIDGNPAYIMNHYYGNNIYYSTCNSNYFNIAFNNDRREWIDAMTVKLYYTQYNQQPRQFNLKARNAGEDWTTLSEVTGLTWSQIGQSHTIYFQNNKAFNEYRFENFATGDTSGCYWKLGTLDLKSVMTAMTIPELSYSSSISIFKDIEMGEEYPNSEYYYGFTVTPSLPNGITLDPNTGIISGTATAEMSSRSYSVTANKLTGGTSTTSFSLGVGICTGGRSLVTLVARTDSSPQKASYKLYQGIGTNGTVVDQIDQFRSPSSLNYGDFCMSDGIYTLELLDSTLHGWSIPAGYYLTVDLGEMIFELGQVPTGYPSVSTMFSTYLPFQINYSDWKVNKETVVNWYNLDYDDSAWSTVKAANIGTSTEITTYIRHDVNIPDINHYHVLNIRMKYTGGIAAYFNGRLVARFNLEENFDSESKSISLHDINTFSKFHVVMSTVGAVTGKNVMAFETHLPIGQSTSSSVVFDATGVFGVNACSVVVDTIIDIDGTDPIYGTLEQLFDLDPVTYGYQPNDVGTYLVWTVENLEGTKFNSFAMQTPYFRTFYGFSLYVRSKPNDEEEYSPALSLVNQSTKSMGRASWSVLLGIAGFRQLRFEVDDVANGYVYVNSYILQYCKPSGTGVCPAIGDYPSVGEGEISPSYCEYGYRGYSYRTCKDGQLGPVQQDKCVQKEPVRLMYDASIYNLIKDTSIRIASPGYMNIIEKFYMAENTFLPEGLTLNPHTGEITGIPTQEGALNAYTIYGSNSQGVAFVVISISVQKGTCKAEGLFPTTNVGEVAVYECASGGSYIGTQKRACVLGTKDGVWQDATGMCMSIALLAILILLVTIVISLIVFLVVRVNRKTKAVGGLRGKPTNKKSLNKTAVGRVVKV